MFLKLHLLIALATLPQAFCASVPSVGGSDITDAAMSSNNPQAPTTAQVGQREADNPTFSFDEKEKASRYISILDRLLNRNQNRVTGTGGSTATATGTGVTNTANAASGVRPAVNPIFGKVPDVSAGIDTILNGVASGNLEQIITGSFIFSPNRVQNVANGVINRVFGGPSISTINNPANAAPGTVGGANGVNTVSNSQQTQQVDGAAGLVQAVNDIRQQPAQSVQQPQQLQPVAGGVANNNIQSGVGTQQQQGQQLNRIPGQSGIGNLISAVLGGFLLG